MKNAVIYVRVSDPGQAEEELSIPSQIERCRAKAAELGADVVRVYADEGKSGRFDARPAFKDAIAYCESFPVDYLITWSTSRFARNKIDAALYKLRLEKAGTAIVYVSQQIDRNDDTGWVTESMFEIFDELQSRMISKDTRRSMETNARNGHWNGGAVPFGYMTVPDPSNPKRKRLAPREDEAALARRMFDLRIDGYGSKEIARQLNEQGLLNRGRRWNKASVLRLLRNETVIGHIVFGRRSHRFKQLRPRESWIVVKSHEAIVDPDKFAAVQAMLGDADMTGAGAHASMRSGFVFTGMLKCARCGGAMTTESARGRSRAYHYYNCRAAIVHGDCPSRRIPAAEFDAWMIDQLCTNVFTRRNLEGIVADLQRSRGSWAREQKRRRTLITRRIEDVQQKRARLFEILELHGKGAPNLADIAARLREHNEAIKAAQAELAELDAEQEPAVAIEDCDVGELADILTGLVRTAENPKKLRLFFSTFVDRIAISGTDVRIEYRPDRLVSAPGGTVHSMEDWLPVRALQRTGGPVRVVVAALPERFRRAA